MLGVHPYAARRGGELHFGDQPSIEAWWTLCEHLLSLNRYFLSRIQAGTSKLDFKFEFGTCRVVDRENPSKSAALDEDWVRERLAVAGLRVAEATYGTWSGGMDMLGAFQDMLISVKK